MNLSDIKKVAVPRSFRKRVGRGIGSGHGKTAGRGHKGQRSRTNHGNLTPTYEGGQMPLFRRLPKRGFNNNRFRFFYGIVNVNDLNRFEDGATIDLDSLRKSGLIKGAWDGVKVLGNGDLKKKLTVKAHRFSISAEQKIVAAGGKVEKLGMKIRTEKK